MLGCAQRNTPARNSAEQTPLLEKQLKAALAALVAMTTMGTATTDHLVPEYYAPVDLTRPGYGRDSSNAAPTTPVHEPMAYGLFASSLTVDGLATPARSAADWLVENQDLDGDGIPGWGLPFPWDAFNDGSINPAHTVYGITTAIAVQGLLDFYEATGETKYLDVAVSALEAYASERTAEGSFHYSRAKTDRTPVHNVTAMMMGQFARAARLSNKKNLQTVATRSYEYLMALAHDDEDGIWWNYVEGHPKKNDLVHASYMVRGLIDYGASGEIIYKSNLHLSRFVRNNIVYDTIDHDTHKARSWGIGTALQVACTLKEFSLAQQLKLSLPQYLSGGAYLLYPGMGYYAPRLQGHVAWGLSACSVHPTL